MRLHVDPFVIQIISITNKSYWQSGLHCEVVRFVSLDPTFTQLGDQAASLMEIARHH